MKFGKRLNSQIEKTLPEWQDKFLSYKELKKKLKLLEPAKPPPAAAEDRPSKRPKVDADDYVEGADFRNLLERELDKFNNFFVEKEEEYIIRLKVPLFRPFLSLIWLNK